MKSNTPPLRAMAVFGLALLTQTVSAQPPPVTTGAEHAAIDADAASLATKSAEAAASTARVLEKDLADGAAASAAAASFLVQAEIPPVSTDAVPPPSRPLDVKPGPNDTVINCEGGMYFDPKEGVLVYLKNVTVKDPRFNLSGANELKVFFGKKAADATKKEGPAKPRDGLGGNVGADFGDVERVVATGAILIDQKPQTSGKEPIKASGAIFSYNIKEDQIIIKGGFPWVLQGSTYMRAKEANLALRISPKAGGFSTEGNWDMGGNIEQKK